mmetsp:Transcript_50835/g.91363  ORF Transcript_50835/g.91363 Transcript_50835/m.91363 type:complete len:581 (+) Transcript_50835:66-1808(+)
MAAVSISAAPAASVGARGEPPSRCAECGNVLTDALVLSCGHDLCLNCAAGALRQTRSLSGRTVRCLLCTSVTELCEEAAATLKSSIPPEAPLEQQPPLPPQPQGIPAPNGQNSSSQCMSCGNSMPDAIYGRHVGHTPRSQGPVAASNWGGAVSSSCPSMYPRMVQTAGRSPREATEESAFRSRPVSEGRPRPLQMVSPGPETPATSRAPSPRMMPREPVADALQAETENAWSGRTAHMPRCPVHPEEPATYFCATCEVPCICAECVVQKNGIHRDHEVLRVGRAHEVLKARAGILLDEAVALEDDFSVIGDRIAWRRKDIERTAGRGRASVRTAFQRVRAQLNEREAELLQSLDTYESESLGGLDSGHDDHAGRIAEIRRLQDNLRSHCRSGRDAVEALNTYAAAKSAIASLREIFRQEEINSAGAPDEFVGLAGSARSELDLHAEGLASLEQAVASLCEKGDQFAVPSPKVNASQSLDQTFSGGGTISVSHPRVQGGTNLGASSSAPNGFTATNGYVHAVPNGEVSTKCLNCGNVFMADANFCRHCGQKRDEVQIAPALNGATRQFFPNGLLPRATVNA